MALTCRADSSTAPLTWDDLAQIAAAQNPELSAARHSENAAQARYKGSFNSFLPSVGLNSSYSDSDAHNPGSRWQAGGNASLNILDGSSYFDIKVSKASRNLAKAQRQITSSDVRFNLFSAYAGLLFAQEQVRVAQKIQELRHNNAQTVSLKYQSGREYKGNSLRAQAELVQADADLAQAQRDLRAAQAELNRRLGRDEFTALAVTETWETSAVPPEPNVASLVATNPQYTVAAASLLVSKENLNRTRSAYWPALSANYSRSFQDSIYFPGNPRWSAAAVVSFPLFGQGLTSPYYNVSAGRQDMHAQEENLRASIYQIRSGLQSAWSDLAARTDSVKVQRQFLQAAQQQNDEASIRYTSGLMTFENWEIVVTDLVNFEKGYINSQRAAALADAAWKHALGTPLEE